MNFYSPKLVLETDLGTDKYLIVSTGVTGADTSFVHLIVGAAHRFVLGTVPVWLAPPSPPTKAAMLATLLGKAAPIKGPTKNSLPPLPPTKILPSASKDTAKMVLKQGGSVVWPTVSPVDKDLCVSMVEAAMLTGALLLPSVSFELPSKTAPGRSTVGVVYGEPMVVPHTSSPHTPLVHEFASTFMTAHAKLLKKYQGVLK